VHAEPADLPPTRALAHRCPTCRRDWALRLVEHPAGDVLLCRYCRAVRRVVVPAQASEHAEPPA
jgi:hypothetical protein